MIKKNLEGETLFLIEKGLYSDKSYVPYLEVIANKYGYGDATIRGFLDDEDKRYDSERNGPGISG